MTDKTLQKKEQDQQFEDNFNDLPPSDIVAFNELRSCADLLRLYQSKQLEIQPDFQRDIVWSKPDQTRFIDSLTKQLPIPSMCISLDYKTDKRLVIDGLQRMNSIINFLSNDGWQLSDLEDIDAKLSRRTVAEIKAEAIELYERVQNVMIPVTVIRCDYSKASHNEYLFTIFHRLNSGGVRLNNQEIRNCIYNGPLNDLLKELSQARQTKRLFGIKSRFANEEMILRFFAFNDGLVSYNGKLSKFLNDYMFVHRNISGAGKRDKADLYNKSTMLVLEVIFNKSSASSYGKTFLEGLLFGVSQNLDKLVNEGPEKVQFLFEQFKQLPEYSLESLRSGLSAKEKVIERLSSSKICFAS
jgi:hypothetical protein